MNEKPLAIITGASNGIGRATAVRLAAEGMRILSMDRVAPGALLEDETFLRVDLLEERGFVDALARIAAESPASVLVNNAAVVKLGSLEDLSADKIRISTELNTIVPFRLAQAVVQGMKARHYGRIVNISSRAALGKELRTAYSASKAALIGMTRTWALELAAHGITVNCIGPGPVATEMFKAANPPESEQTQSIMRAIPVRRLGEPEEVAHAVSFFAHPLAGFTTGQVVYVCGGMTVGLVPV